MLLGVWGLVGGPSVTAIWGTDRGTLVFLSHCLDCDLLTVACLCDTIHPEVLTRALNLQASFLDQPALSRMGVLPIQDGSCMASVGSTSFRGSGVLCTPCPDPQPSSCLAATGHPVLAHLALSDVSPGDTSDFIWELPSVEPQSPSFSFSNASPPQGCLLLGSHVPHVTEEPSDGFPLAGSPPGYLLAVAFPSHFLAPGIEGRNGRRP